MCWTSNYLVLTLLYFIFLKVLVIYFIVIQKNGNIKWYKYLKNIDLNCTNNSLELYLYKSFAQII